MAVAIKQIRAAVCYAIANGTLGSCGKRYRYPATVMTMGSSIKDHSKCQRRWLKIADADIGQIARPCQANIRLRMNAFSLN